MTSPTFWKARSAAGPGADRKGARKEAGTWVRAAAGTKDRGCCRERSVGGAGIKRGTILICCDGGGIRVAGGSKVKCGERGVKDDPRSLT